MRVYVKYNMHSILEYQAVSFTDGPGKPTLLISSNNSKPASVFAVGDKITLTCSVADDGMS